MPRELRGARLESQIARLWAPEEKSWAPEPGKCDVAPTGIVDGAAVGAGGEKPGASARKCDVAPAELANGARVS